MTVSPFIYEQPLPPEDMIDREQEAGRLLSLAEAGRFVRLTAPRRYGKTSLLLKVLRDAERAGMPNVLVDLYGVVSVAEVAHRLERAYAKQLKGTLRQKVEDFFNASGLGLSLGALGVSARLERAKTPDPIPALHALLDVPEQTMARSGQRALVVFDEFQDILPLGVDAAMRSHIQFQGGSVSYIFSGSEPGMMRGLFEDRARPLYGQAVPERLGRLEDGDIAAYASARFKRTGKAAGEVLPALLEVAQGHPQRAMLLAHELWEQTEPKATADDSAWSRALAKALREAAAEFDARWRGLETGDQRLLRAMVLSDGSPYSRKALAMVDLKKGSAGHAVNRLLDRGELEEAEPGLRLVDPLFKLWLRQAAQG